MRKDEIIKRYFEFISETGIAPEDFVIGAGGALVMMGLREETSDMDMSVPIYAFVKFLNAHKYLCSHYEQSIVLTYDNAIDLHIADEGDVVVIDGVTCYSPERLLEMKLAMNRGKDQADIAALLKYIG